MRILIIGFLAFSMWSTLSAYIYVCKIKGLCDEPMTLQASVTDNKNDVVKEIVQKPLVKEQMAVPEDMLTYFAFDKSDFSSNGESDKYFNESNAYLDLNSQAKLSIIGYTDAIGSNAYNQALGYRRAQTMQHYFEKKGINADKIIIESKGEKEPADNNNTSAGRANNRRTVITIKK